MTSVVTSKHGIPIRLPDERWAHVTEEHAEPAGLRLEVLETIAEPEAIVAGRAGERLAVRQLEPGKWLVAIYPASTASFAPSALSTSCWISGPKGPDDLAADGGTW